MVGGVLTVGDEVTFTTFTFFPAALAIATVGVSFYHYVAKEANRQVDKRIRAFEHDLDEALKSDRTIEQVFLIAEVNGVNRQDVRAAMKRLLRQIYVGCQNGEEAKLAMLEEFLRVMEESEPFYNIRGEIRTHLERLMESGVSRVLLAPLTDQIRLQGAELNDAKKASRGMNRLSFVFGVVGVFWGVYSWYAPRPAAMDSITTAHTVTAPAAGESEKIKEMK